MRGLFERIYRGNYTNEWTIFGIDMLLSLLATFTSIMLFSIYITHRPRLDDFGWVWMGMAAVSSAVAFISCRTHRSIIRHTSLREVVFLALSATIKVLIMAVMFYIIHHHYFRVSMRTIFGVLFVDLFFTLCILGLFRVLVVLVYSHACRIIKATKHNNVFVYGDDEKAQALAVRFKASQHYHVVGMLVYGNRVSHVSMGGIRVHHFTSKRDILGLCAQYGICGIIFPTNAAAQHENERLIPLLREVDVKPLIAPPLDEYDAINKPTGGIRQVKIEDLLGREEIKINLDAIRENVNGKVVMVTGAAGSIGSELCRQLAKFGVQRLILFDNAETPMHNVRLEFEEKYPNLNFVPVIGDVRQEPRLDFAFRKYRPQIVFHAAAYKHVPLMEENPCEAVRVNVFGSYNLANKCVEYDVEKMVMVSTDKAVNPTNIMGCTKRLAEIYVQSLGLTIEKGACPLKSKSGKEVTTKFVTTRFGNVLGSNGSVIPRFRDQIEKGGPITVTHPDITRFFMTIPEACRLVMEAATMTEGNQIFVFDMGESVKIVDLAKRMIELAGFKVDEDIPIVFTGLRPGEKLYEEVLATTENTTPTHYDRIRIADVRQMEYNEVKEAIITLAQLSEAVRIPEMVQLMKKTVPEFISKNSEFEIYDNK